MAMHLYVMAGGRRAGDAEHAAQVNAAADLDLLETGVAGAEAAREQFAAARRQVGRFLPLNLTISGSVARPRDALSKTE